MARTLIDLYQAGELTATGLRPHGTQAAIRRHERHGEGLCEACRLERNRLARIYHQRRRKAATNHNPRSTEQ